MKHCAQNKIKRIIIKRKRINMKKEERENN